jgi:uncharacterized protein (TIGR04255 family)
MLGGRMTGLPEYVSLKLVRSPLVLVAAQINFEEVGKDVTHLQAREVQRALDDSWTGLQAAPQVRTTLTPSGAVNEPQRGAYRLSSGDASWSLAINTDSVILETRAYTGWDDMSSRLYAIAAVVAKVLDPAQRLRIGLRYVDQVPLPDGQDDWTGLIPDELLGVGAHPVLGTLVTATEHRCLLQLAPDARCLFRHGLMQEADPAQGTAPYLLDYDVFNDSPAPFGVEDLRDAAEALHQYAGALFRASVTEDLYAWLKGG